MVYSRAMLDKIPDAIETAIEVRKIAAESPDHIDPNAAAKRSCKYAKDGKPSCIIGHAWARLGMSVKDLAAFDDADNPVGLLYLETHTDPEYDIDNTPPAEFFLNAVQREQDRGKSWGVAVAAAAAARLNNNRKDS